MKAYFKFLIFLCCAGTFHLYPQDMVNSNIPSAPLLYSPSLMGGERHFLAAVNYRLQWFDFVSPLQYFGFNLSNVLYQSKKEHQLNMGIAYFRYFHKELKVFNSHFTFNLAYLLKLNNVRIGSGFYIGDLRSGLDFREARWLSQYDGSQYNPSLPSGEKYANRLINYGDSDIGIGCHVEYASAPYPQKKYSRFLFSYGAYHLSTFPALFGDAPASFVYLPVRHSALLEWDKNWFSLKALYTLQKPIENLKILGFLNLYTGEEENKAIRIGIGANGWSNTDTIEKKVHTSENLIVQCQLVLHHTTYFFTYEPYPTMLKATNTFEIGIQFYTDKSLRIRQRQKIKHYNKMLLFYE